MPLRLDYFFFFFSWSVYGFSLWSLHICNICTSFHGTSKMVFKFALFHSYCRDCSVWEETTECDFEWINEFRTTGYAELPVTPTWDFLLCIIKHWSRDYSTFILYFWFLVVSCNSGSPLRNVNEAPNAGLRVAQDATGNSSTVRGTENDQVVDDFERHRGMLNDLKALVQFLLDILDEDRSRRGQETKRRKKWKLECHFVDSSRKRLWVSSACKVNRMKLISHLYSDVGYSVYELNLFLLCLLFLFCYSDHDLMLCLYDVLKRLWYVMGLGWNTFNDYGLLRSTLWVFFFLYCRWFS